MALYQRTVYYHPDKKKFSKDVIFNICNASGDSPQKFLEAHRRTHPTMYDKGVEWSAFHSETWPAPWTNWKPESPKQKPPAYRQVHYNGKMYWTNGNSSLLYTTPDEAIAAHRKDCTCMYTNGNSVVWSAPDSASWPAPFTNWQPGITTDFQPPVSDVPQTSNSNEVISTMQIAKPVYAVGVIPVGTKTDNDNNTISTYSNTPTGVVLCETIEERDRQIITKQQIVIAAMATGIVQEVFVATIDGFAALPKPTITKL